jgi:hypothetical protein
LVGIGSLIAGDVPVVNTTLPKTAQAWAITDLAVYVSAVSLAAAVLLIIYLFESSGQWAQSIASLPSRFYLSLA